MGEDEQRIFRWRAWLGFAKAINSDTGEDRSVERVEGDLVETVGPEYLADVIGVVRRAAVPGPDDCAFW